MTHKPTPTHTLKPRTTNAEEIIKLLTNSECTVRLSELALMLSRANLPLSHIRRLPFAISLDETIETCTKRISPNPPTITTDRSKFTNTQPTKYEVLFEDKWRRLYMSAFGNRSCRFLKYGKCRLLLDDYTEHYDCR